MANIKKISLLILLATVLLCLVSCGSKKPVEITLVAMTEDTQVLNIQYTAHKNLAKDDVTLRISVSNDSENATGKVYCDAEVSGDLQKGTQYVGLFYMTSDHSWNIDGSLNLGGATVLNTLNTADILSVFGEDATVTASFLVGGDTVSEMVLEKE